MFSDLPKEKSRAPDAESLLGNGQPEEPLLSQQARSRIGLTTYLHFLAIILYISLATYLYLWSVRLSTIACESKSTVVYSPAQTAVQYEKKTIVHNVADDGKYRGPPRPEQDEAWESLLRYNNLRVQEADLEKANLTSVPLKDDAGGYLATLDVFHSLHCVNKVRKSYYSDYYHDPNPIADQQEHFDHCIDLLRQVIMCHGDISLHTYEWKDDYRWPWPSMQTTHQCRNWDMLMEWSKDHNVPSLTGPILSHPSLGTSFRGDEPHT